MTLWVLFCRINAQAGTLFTFYARDRQHAQEQADELLSIHGYEYEDLREYPYGFVISSHTRIPGSMEEDLP